MIGDVLYVDGKRVMPIRGGVAMFNPQFTRFRLYASGSESGSSPLEDQDVDHTLNVDSDVEIQLRVFAQNIEAAGSTDDWRLDYDKNIAGFVLVPATSTGTGIEGALAGLTNDASTTNRTTNGIADGDNSFDAGAQITDGIGSVTLNADNYGESVFGLKFIASEVSDGDTFDFQMGKPNAFVNTIVPRITIEKSGEVVDVPLLMAQYQPG